MAYYQPDKYCNFGFDQLENYFQENFNCNFPHRMKIDAPLITPDRSGRKPIQCESEEECKNTTCQKHSVIGSMLFEPDSFFYRPLAFEDMHGFMNKEIANYYAIGFDSHGANNSSFYYIRADNWRKIYMRLNLFGLYRGSDIDKIGRFLTKYFEFEEKLEGKVDYLQVQQNYGEGTYTIKKKEQTITRNYRLSIEDIDFNLMLDDILP
jgi:hypothetical protein